MEGEKRSVVERTFVSSGGKVSALTQSKRTWICVSRPATPFKNTTTTIAITPSPSQNNTEDAALFAILPSPTALDFLLEKRKAPGSGKPKAQ